MKPTIKIAITGAEGQMGRTLKRSVHDYPQFECVFLSREDLSIDQPEAIRHFFEKSAPSICINCAAYTAVDRAEQERDQAFRINGDSVGILASQCAVFHTKLIHLSTDYVFDGISGKPLREEDPYSPLNAYGASKQRGEQLAMQNNTDTLIIRTSWLYSEYGNNFVKTMIRLMAEKESINVVDDQIGSPTYAADLSSAMLQIIDSGKFVPGIYHYSNDGKISWFEFAQAIKEIVRSHCKINPIPSSQYPTPAKRPAYSLLDKSKIKAVYQVAVPDWKTSLVTCIQCLQEKGRAIN